MVKIQKVIKDSLADNIGIMEGDVLVSINGREINDVLDYRFYIADQRLCIKIKRDSENEFIIEKQLYDDIGLEFETPLASLISFLRE